jgi:uncharacterized protein YgiM (DUF1202 family)
MKQPLRQNGVHTGAARLLLAVILLLAFASLACSVGETLVGRSAGVVPTPTKTPRPTFTPLPTLVTGASTVMPGVRGVLPPGVTVQAPNSEGSSAPIAASTAISGTQGSVTDGAINIVLYATETPPPSPTLEPAGPTPEPTQDFETNRPTREGGPRPLPTPYAIVKSATINGRRGPGATFERIGQAKKGDELMIIGRTPDGAWWQVCCLANQPVWVSADLVEAKGPVDTTPLLTPAPTPVPPPPAAPLPTATPAPTPMPPFDIARGPEFPIQRDNGTMTMLAQVYEGPFDNQHPLGGYQLKVFRNGVDVTQNELSFDNRDFDATLAVEGGFKYNLKFEMPNAGEADWKIYLARPGGFRVSPVSEFTTTGDSYRNQVVYIAYVLAR